MALRYVSLTGLGFGDCGKGLFTDALCRHWQAHTVVRYNGGAQAGHNVVLPDGRHHTFSQFAAGSFVPDVVTLLAAPVVVHPTALLVEALALRSAGVSDPLARLMIDARCAITTPYHQAAGRLREWRRGDGAHGSCGVGVGETVRHSLRHPDQALRYGDLIRPRLALQKLESLRATIALEFDLAAAPRSERWIAEARLLADPGAAAHWLAQASEVTRRVPPAGPAAVAERLTRSGTVLFEGAQGMLLDEWRGFHPHTSWSSVGPAAVAAVLADADANGPLQHFGVLRAYLTRHGAGPLPTHDLALDAIPEPHNIPNGWQGPFRRGHPDAVLLRYAIDAAGPLDGLLLSHLDALSRGPELKWCDAYRAAPAPGDESACARDPRQIDRVVRLTPGRHGDLAHQSALTSLLRRAQPLYAPRPLRSANDLIARLEAVADCRVHLASRGPTHRDVEWLGASRRRH